MVFGHFKNLKNTNIEKKVSLIKEIKEHKHDLVESIFNKKASLIDKIEDKKDIKHDLVGGLLDKKASLIDKIEDKKDIKHDLVGGLLDKKASLIDKIEDIKEHKHDLVGGLLDKKASLIDKIEDIKEHKHDLVGGLLDKKASLIDKIEDKKDIKHDLVGGLLDKKASLIDKIEDKKDIKHDLVGGLLDKKASLIDKIEDKKDIKHDLVGGLLDKKASLIDKIEDIKEHKHDLVESIFNKKASLIDKIKDKKDPVNEAPEFTNLPGNGKINILENTTLVTDINATDVNGDTEGNGLTYSIVGGTDNNFFTINETTGELSFQQAQDFENPLDGNKNNIYDVTVQVTDSQGASTTKDLWIMVNDQNEVAVNEAPEFTNFPENGKVNIIENTTFVMNLDAEDANGDVEGNGLKYSIVEGTGKKFFKINHKTGRLSFKQAPDFENPQDINQDNIYDITVRVTDSKGAFTDKPLWVMVNNEIEEQNIEAVDDNVTTNAGKKVVVKVLANDNTSDGNTQVFLESFAQPENGRVIRNNNGTKGDTSDDKLAYIPNEGFSGTDTFTYTINDGNGATDTANVTVEVKPVFKPVAKLVGDNMVEEGNSGHYFVEIDKPSTEDRVFQIQVNDGSANRFDGDGSGQDIMWGGMYDLRRGIGGEIVKEIEHRIPNGTDPESGNRPMLGTVDASQDFTVYDRDGSINHGNIIEVVVKAGETHSQPFEVQAWKEKVTVDRDLTTGRSQAFLDSYNENYNEGVENFSLKIVGGSNGFNIDRSTFNVDIKDGTNYKFVSPIAFDLNGDGVKTIGIDKGVMFDMLNKGTKVSTGWLSGQDGFLAVDSNGNNQIDDLKELFGGSVGEGFAKLESFDSNKDGVVDVKDEAFGELKVWQDGNENGLTDNGELVSLESAGIAAINTTYEDVFTQDAQGNILGEHGSAVSTTGDKVQVVDVYFQTAE